jgi:hypothetical protein
MHHLFSQHVLHDAIISVGKVEEQLHVIATMDASNQLIVAYKNVDHMFEPNDPIKIFKEGKNYPSIGIQLAWT